MSYESSMIDIAVAYSCFDAFENNLFIIVTFHYKFTWKAIDPFMSYESSMIDIVVAYSCFDAFENNLFNKLQVIKYM